MSVRSGYFKHSKQPTAVIEAVMRRLAELAETAEHNPSGDEQDTAEAGMLWLFAFCALKKFVCDCVNCVLCVFTWAL